MMCYKYTYESWCFMFTWGATLALVVPMGCGCMGHITTWAYVDDNGLGIKELWVLNPL